MLRLDMAQSGGALVVSLSGEPGIGKTRLAAELAALARAGGLAQLYGRADDRLSVPFPAQGAALARPRASALTTRASRPGRR